MKDEVLRIDKCEACGKNTRYIVRSLDKNINRLLKDFDINNMISAYHSNPYSYDDCDHCNIYSLKKTVGWVF